MFESIVDDEKILMKKQQKTLQNLPKGSLVLLYGMILQNRKEMKIGKQYVIIVKRF